MPVETKSAPTDDPMRQFALAFKIIIDQALLKEPVSIDPTRNYFPFELKHCNSIVNFYQASGNEKSDEI